jgi:hypothetical protein
MRDLSIYWLWEPRHWSPRDEAYHGPELEQMADAFAGCPAARRLAVVLAEARRAGVPRARLVQALGDMARVVVHLDYASDASDRSFASHALVLACSGLGCLTAGTPNLRVVLDMLNDGAAHRATAVVLSVALEDGSAPIKMFGDALTILAQLARTVPRANLNRLVLECTASVYRRIFPLLP